MADNLAARRELFACEVLAGGDEVGEGVALRFALAIGVPGIALVLAAADVGDGIDEAAVDQAEAGCRETRRDRDAVAAIAVEQQRGGAIDRRVTMMHDADRDLGPIAGGRIEAARDVVGRIMAARHFLGLAQRTAAVSEVVVVGLRRRRHRGVGETHGGGVELITGAHAEAVGFFVEGDGMLGAIVQLAHDDLR